MKFRTDLAVESFDHIGNLPNGITVNETKKNGISITEVNITNDLASNAIKKPKGKYITIELSDFKSVSSDFKSEVETTANEIKALIPDSQSSVLIAGLGNSDITPDSIGPLATSMIFATRHISGELAKEIGLDGLRPIAAITPGVLGQTGMETGEIISSICNEISPCAVIAIDALAAISLERLGNTVQISDTGITPGSGVQNARKALDYNTLGVPVISIGVPTVADMSSVVGELSEGAKQKLPRIANGMLITPKEIDVIAEHAAKTVAFAINRALLPELDFETLESLIS